MVINLTDLRAKLDRLNDQIVGRLKDRSWFVLNGRPNISLMKWSLEGLERYHATLGMPNRHGADSSA